MEIGPHALRTMSHPAGSPLLAKPLDIRHLLIQATELHPTEANGVHRVASKIAIEQSAAGHSVSLISLREPSLPAAGDIEGLRSRSVALTSRTLFGRGAWLAKEALEDLVAGAGPSTVFHIHSAREPLLVSICMALRRLSVRYAITVHGRYSHMTLNSIKTSNIVPLIYVKFIERYVLEGASFVHAVSPDERDIIRTMAPRARIEMIQNAAYSMRTDTPFTFPLRTGSTGYGPRFGYLGRYAIKHKGLDILLEAFRLYRDGGGRGSLELFGTGSTSDIAALLKEHRLQNIVSVAGGQFGDRKLATFARWDYFVQPSRFEGSPIGIMEAALAGLPVIVTPGTGLSGEVARFNAGFPVKRPTPQDLCDSLLLADGVTYPQWKSMSANSHTMAKSFGDWTSIASQLNEKYLM